MPRREDQSRIIRGQHSDQFPLAWRLEAPTADPALPLVLGLHGWGMNEDLFARLLRGLLGFPCRLLLPRAPLAIPDRSGASWYDYDGNQERFHAELLRCEETVLSLVKTVERNQELKPRSRWLLGFSQGGYCGSWIGLRNAGYFRGMAIVGARVKTEILTEEMARAADLNFEVLLCHGRQDVSVPPAAAENSLAGLEAAGLEVELQWFDAGHTMGKQPVETIAQWLENRNG